MGKEAVDEYDVDAGGDTNEDLVGAGVDAAAGAGEETGAACGSVFVLERLDWELFLAAAAANVAAAVEFLFEVIDLELFLAAAAAIVAAATEVLAVEVEVDVRELLAVVAVVEDGSAEELSFNAFLIASDTDALSADEGRAGIVKLDLILGVGGVAFGIGSSDIPTVVVDVFTLNSLTGGGGGKSVARESEGAFSEGNRELTPESPEGLISILGRCFGIGGGES